MNGLGKYLISIVWCFSALALYAIASMFPWHFQGVHRATDLEARCISYFSWLKTAVVFGCLDLLFYVGVFCWVTVWSAFFTATFRSVLYSYPLTRRILPRTRGFAGQQVSEIARWVQ